jgi:hypothetical protein
VFREEGAINGTAHIIVYLHRRAIACLPESAVPQVISMHLLPLRRRLSLQALDRVQDPVLGLGAGHVALV